VLETIDDISSSETSSSAGNSNEQTTDNHHILQLILRERKPKITAIATDVDGTLLSFGQDLHPQVLVMLL
jgi:hypothetical protein